MKFTNALAASALFAAPAFAGLVVQHTVEGSKVVSSVTNDGTEAVTVADHPESVVGSEYGTDIFKFESEDGESPEFTGIALKWDPTSATGTVIEAGETKEFEQDISDVYSFKEGESTYTVSGGDKIFTLSPDGKVVPGEATVVPTTAKVSGATRKRSYTPVYGSLGKRALSYPGCSASQIATIKTAAAEAQKYIQNTLSYAASVNSANINDRPRYTWWFGAFTPARGALVTNHFSQLVNDPTSEITSYDCSTCTRAGVYAYVYPNQPLKIYLCPVFWSAPMTGTDSKAGTIVHELSHFDQNGGTRDHAYGHTNAHALAGSNPDLATMNADSHEYFAENTPALA
jgi:peptidyl-Lys metalloendopeptidase